MRLSVPAMIAIGTAVLKLLKYAYDDGMFDGFRKKPKEPDIIIANDPDEDENEVRY